ncbi:MAG: radical SAM protein [Victivallales bacterium]|nr:radical SAM protein [Victivallales bacterium]
MEIFLTMRKRAEFPHMMSVTPEDMPMDVVLRALDIVAESKSPQVLFKGNEPLLHPDLEMIVKGCQKRGIIPVFETSGLMPTAAKKMVLEQGFHLIWRLYRPAFYSAENMAEMRENLDAFMKAGCLVRLNIMVDDPDADYEFVREYLDTYTFDSVNFWVSCLTPQDKIGHAMEFYTKLSRDYLAKKVHPHLTCGIMPCAMTDAQFGLLAKIGNHFGHCMPHLGVLPDGRVCHCEEMAMLPGPNLSMFRTERELQKFYYDVFRELQWTMDVCPQCKECISMAGGVCTGLSMAQKAHAMLADFEKYKQRLETEHGELSEEERTDLLWQMTKVCLILALYSDAVECLEELRRQHPENPNAHFHLGVCYWELGRLSDGEDEFRKCARLSENPLIALGELHRRLVQNGNTIRARLLQAEIEKEAVKLQQKMDENKPKA